MKAQRILLASHGTAGGRAADRVAVDLCYAPGVEVVHLTVIPALWRGAMGDDWLNNASTRDAYCKHLETQLDREITAHRRELEPELAARGARYRAKVVIGAPTQCLLDCAAEVEPDLVVLGSPRPPGTPGLRSRLRVAKLLERLAAPLLIVPHPSPAS